MPKLRTGMEKAETNCPSSVQGVGARQFSVSAFITPRLCYQKIAIVAILFTLLASRCLFRTSIIPSAPHPGPREIFHASNQTWQVSAPDQQDYLELKLPLGLAFVLDGASGRYVLPSNASLTPIEGTGLAWVLPSSPSSNASAYMISANADISIRFENDTSTCLVTVHSSSANITIHKARPHADIDGNEFSLQFPGSDSLADALAGFYWDTMLRCVVERTTAASYPLSEGYVISTLASQYSGTYPDVDHEFQIKGRIAMGGTLDLAVVRRMIELGLKLIREDPIQQFRAPCALQPDGDREYHVRRNSQDGTTNADMFLLTGNIELIESVWLFVARTKDLEWLRANLDDIEGAAWLIEWHMDPLGRLWSDVYYEDQVMKDGRETMSAALASRAFGLLAQLEVLLDRKEIATRYTALQRLLSETLAEPMPIGYWDSTKGRFVDWVDRSGVGHDHIHLLANILPVMFGAAGASQTDKVLELIDANLDDFQRFPSFLAVDIADYTDDEIGDGGPYDLCAAGRYWAWDAAFWRWRRNCTMLRDQLDKVAEEGRLDGYIMGERYDMDHVYYIDGVDWHGAAHYYEYPCVYAWVLIHEFLGIRPSLDVDLEIAPRLVEAGSVTLHQTAYQLSYDYRPDGFTLENLSSMSRIFEIDLTALYPAGTNFFLRTSSESYTGPLEGRRVKIGPGEMCIIDALL